MNEIRYFYTDPLAAAWMAKHFGMRFEFDDLKHTVEAVLLRRIYEGKPMVVHIHPDSLPLLEPKVGDIVIHLPEPKSYPVQALTITRVDSKEECEKHFGGVPSCWARNWRMAGVVKIIQRNGIPFMWPETDPS